MRKIWLLVRSGIVSILILGGIHGTATAQTVPASLQPTDADHVLGNKDAPITIVEYASLTCSACAAFHNQMLPQLKTRYIDAGKLKLVYRDFPLDRVAVQAAQLAECVDRDRYFAVVATIFQTQASWIAAKDPLADLQKLMRLAGLGEPQAKACLADQKGLEAILMERQGGTALGVDSTPTIFVNGQRYDGPRTLQAFDELFARLIK